MKLNRRSNNAQGYSVVDAMLAIRLIAEEKQLTQTEIAEAVHMRASHFNQCLHLYFQAKKHSLLSEDPLRNPNGTSHIACNFSPMDLARIARFLGKQCGIEKGFVDVGAMVAYAQANCTLPDGERWVHTRVATNDETLVMKEKIGKLSIYKRAAKILAMETECPLYVLVQDISNDKTFLKYLNDDIVAMADTTKVEKLEHFAQLIGARLGIPNLDLPGMVAEAQHRAPGKMPNPDFDTRVNTQGGGKAL